MSSRPRLTPFSIDTLQSLTTTNENNNNNISSIAFSPSSPLFANNQNHNNSYLNNTSVTPNLIKHDITTLVSLKHRQIEDLDQKIENLKRDLQDSDQLRFKWMERCAKLEEQLVAEGAEHARELAASSHDCIKIKSELDFVLKKLKEDDQQEEFFESIGALSLAEDVRERRRLRVEQRQKERQNHNNSSPLSDGKKQNEIGMNTSSSSSSPRTKYIFSRVNDFNRQEQQQEISTSISPYRFRNSSPPIGKNARTLSPPSRFSPIRQKQNDDNKNTHKLLHPGISQNNDVAGCFGENNNSDEVASFDDQIHQNLSDTTGALHYLLNRNKPLKNNKNKQQTSPSRFHHPYHGGSESDPVFGSLFNNNNNNSNGFIQYVERRKPIMLDSSTTPEPSPLLAAFSTQVGESAFEPEKKKVKNSEVFIQTEMIPHKSAALQTETAKVSSRETQTSAHDLAVDRELARMKNTIAKLNAADKRREKRDEHVAALKKRRENEQQSQSQFRRKQFEGERQASSEGREPYREDDEDDADFSGIDEMMSSVSNDPNIARRNLNTSENYAASTTTPSFWHKALQQQKPNDDLYAIRGADTADQIRDSNFSAHSPVRDRYLAQKMFATANTSTPSSKFSGGAAAGHPVFSAPLFDRETNPRPTFYNPQVLQNQVTSTPKEVQAELFELRATVQILKKELTEANRMNFDFREKIRQMSSAEKGF